MSDPIDNATHQEEMNTETFIQCCRPTPEQTEEFWKKLEQWESQNDQ